MLYVQKKSWDSLQFENHHFLVLIHRIYFDDMYLNFNFNTKLSHKSTSRNSLRVAPFNGENRAGTSQGLL